MGNRGVARAIRNIKWIETHCAIPEGAGVGKPVKLAKFQKDILHEIYDTPTRRMIASIGRKNAKTTLAAFLLILHLTGPEARRNSQLYSAAQSRDQAAVLFDLAAKVVRLSTTLRSLVTVRDSAKQLFDPELGTLYRALSAEASTALGVSPIFLVHDELGQVVGPRSKLYEALETAQGAHDNPLSVVISTQAPTDADLLSILIDDAKTKADPETKLMMWTADEDADPFLVKTIKQANPAYGKFLNGTEVKSQAQSAKRMPSREADYRNLILNQRVNRNDPFVSINLWQANGGRPRENDFLNGVVVGVDLSERSDLTALIITGVGADGNTSVGCNFYVPKDGIADRSKRDRVPYDLWVRDGYITATDGATVDYDFVAQRLKDIDDKYGIIAVKFDRWRITYLMAAMDRAEIIYSVDGSEGINLVEHGQGFRSMAPALDSLEADLLNKRFRHGDHPVLTWNSANAVVTRDAAGNRKLDKSKSTGRIDGMVALAMTRDPIEAEDNLSDWLSEEVA